MNDLIAIVGVGAILPEAPDAQTFWRNIQAGHYSITDLPAERWKAELFYNPDPSVPDKTYSKIGGWVRGFKFEPMKMGIAIPPKSQVLIDEAQQWAIVACYQALKDYGYPEQRLDPERVAVVLGNAMAGENHYLSTIRIHLPEYLDILSSLPSFQVLSPEMQAALMQGMTNGVQSRFPEVCEDTMPGELANIIAGRVANVFNFSGPNFVTDAACASSLAALQSAVDGLRFHQFDAVLTGGVDRNMGPESFVKFSKIGALSPDGSRPYADGANGFVMGEGAAVFLLKRLADAERDGDKVYAVIRGIGSSSDGKGKGITAPNPIGQQRAIERAWKNAGVPPETVGLLEGHGTSTPVGDLAEVGSLNSVFGTTGLRSGSVALGSVKSNFGHLKSAAGAAGMLKAVLALHAHELPPSVNFEKPNPRIDFAHSPFYVNTQTHPWEVRPGEVRRAGVSAFGFGGTNFHVVLEEYLPGVLTGERTVFPAAEIRTDVQKAVPSATVGLPAAVRSSLTPYHGLLFLSANSLAELRQSLTEAIDQAERGHLPPKGCPSTEEIGKPERLVIDFENRSELVGRATKALKALETDTPAAWQPLGLQGIYRGSGKPGKVAFLFPGQGSQYVNMLRDLREVEPIVGETFREADATMTPILGRPLTSYIFIDGDKDALDKAELKLRDTVITQPAILTVNVALLRVMEKYGFMPEFVIGHSLGEYAALVAASVLTLTEALEVVCARGQEMTRVTMEDTGCMAAVSAPLEQVEAILKTIPGYVVIANLNSPVQCVIGGETAAVEAAIQAFLAAGFQATKIPVSHAFHTKIVAPASQPLRKVIERMNVQSPKLPIAANVTGDLYPTGREEILDILAAQVASPVQYVRGINRLYEEGARVFVEVGPKRVLSTLAVDVLKGKTDVYVLSTNHPRKGGPLSFHEALCRLYAAGVTGATQPAPIPQAKSVSVIETRRTETAARQEAITDGRLPLTGSVVVSGAGLGLPGRSHRVFDDDNILSLLKGDMRIEPLPEQTRHSMLEKRPVRLVKSEAGAVLQEIDDLELTLKLAGQRGEFDPVHEFGLPQDRFEAIDISTQLAIAAGIEALRDAGIPLVMAYKRTSTGSFLPDRWKLPEALADETGVIFGSAFPGLDRMADEASRFYENQALQKQLDELRNMAALVPAKQTDLKTAFEKRIAELETEINRLDYHLDRRYIFRVLSMGHSQFAEYIGARGPNTHVNAACATTTHAISIAEDWIRSGRAHRVIIIAGDDVISGSLPQWIGTSLMASGAATTEGDLRMAALPFDRRRNGMLIGMGAAALVIESEDAIRERGMRAICEVLATVTANSAYHGTRLNVDHVGQMMETLLQTAERRFGISRSQIAPETVFISHETYTPARGGSAAAEIHALRRVFGEQASRVVITNTKGYTGHTMGVGVEDVIATKALEYSLVPPIAHIEDGFEPDPDLGDLNLSRGGEYPIQYALRLGAGFGSQIALTLLRKIPAQVERVDKPVYQRWLSDVAGYADVELEVVQRTLRIRDQGAPGRTPAKSRWQYGSGPVAWAASVGQIAPAPAVPALPASPAPARPPEAITPAPARAFNSDEVKTYILSAVSQKTGYPVEVLDLDLDLEADLGIDTVKQAELFAAFRAQYNIPRREELRLSDYNTLAKVIGFVEEALGAGVSSAPSAPAPQPGVPQAAPSVEVIRPMAGSDEIKNYILSAVSEKTGYPVEVLDLDLDLEADLGIDTVKQAELFAAVRAQYNIPRREDLRLSDYNTLAKVIAFVNEALAAGNVPSAAPKPEVLQAAAPAAIPQPVPGSEDIKTYVLSAVSEKTGYPTEVLDLDLDLEADLGIDTVKQAELFAAVRAQYDLPRREDLRLSDYNTLAKVIAYVSEAIAAKASSLAVPAPVASESDSAPAIEEAPASIIRRVPVAALRPRLDLCIPTGVSLEEGVRVLVVEGEEKAGESLVRKLRSRRVEVLRLDAGLAPEKITGKVTAWQAEKPIRGVYFLPGMDEEIALDKMTLADWQGGLEKRLYSLYTIMRALPEETYLVCATRLGGLHGYGSDGAASVLGGAISGFAKSVSRERPSAFVKIVDFEADATPAAIASSLIEETLHDPGAVEVGHRDGLRYGIAVVEKPLPAEDNFELAEGSVFLISGGSGGIIRPIAEDLVDATRGTFYLLDRAPLPPADDYDIVRFATDREGLKMDLFARLSEGGKKATPVQVEQALLGLERAVATHQTMQMIEQKGGKAHYLACDVTDPAKISEAVKTVREAEGRLDVFLHAAGLERSRKLESKPPEEFRLVVSVKADGFFNIYNALTKKKLLPRAIIFFSSVAGRFGNSGQADYSAANDLLCKAAAAIHRARPKIKTVAIDWSAWGGVGMATRGNIPTLMKMAGIDMLPPEQAAPRVRLELLAGGGEAVVAGSLGILTEPRGSNGGLDLELANAALHAGKTIHTMLSQVTGFDLNRGLVLEAELDPNEQPFLRDHALNNTPVLPGVMGIEGFSVAAKHIGSVLASTKGSLEVTKLEDIQFLAAFKFYRNEPRRITWKALAIQESGGLVVQATLESERALKTGAIEHVRHFSGKVFLELQGTAVKEVNPAPVWNGSYTVKAEDIYKLYFHGPAFQVLEGVQRAGDTIVGKLNGDLPAITGKVHALLSTPTLVELCFQTAGIWEIGKTGSLALPRSIRNLTLYRQGANGAAVYAEVKPHQNGDGSFHFDARVLDAEGHLYLELEDYRTTPLTYPAEKALLDPLKELVK
jgi:malonyl CoA-acyl carrier protein transacylase